MIYRGWIVAIVSPLVCACLIRAGQGSADGNGGQSPYYLDSPTNVAKALKELDILQYRGAHINQPRNPTFMYAPNDYYGTCADAIDFLVRTKLDVGNDLLRLATTAQPLRVKYRAVRILAARGNPAALPGLEAMVQSDVAVERYLGWFTYGHAVRDGKLQAAPNEAVYLALYAKETEDEVREQMEQFFGATKLKAAVRPLVQGLKDRRADVSAVWALGEIGDSSVVPLLIEHHKKNHNPHFHIQALGKLATPQAVEFLIQHLDDYGAPDALFQSGSEKALPALEKHLATLLQKPSPDQMNLSATRIAVIRLKELDPRESLMRIAENPAEHEDPRRDAFRALQKSDTKPYEERILKVYRTELSDVVKWSCVWLLEESRLDGVSEAMMAHALDLEIACARDHMVAHDLQRALNRRLGISFRDWDAMLAYLRKMQTK